MKFPALALALATAVCFSGAADSAYDRLPFNTISAEDGLSNDSVYCLLQDRRGFIWIGTFGGLDRYDGKQIVSYKPGGSDGFSLGASVVFALAEGPDGEIWVGTDGGGLDRLDPDSGQVEPYRCPGSSLIYALAAERDGDLWVGTGGAGLVRRDGRDGSFRAFTAATSALGSDVVRALLLDSAGRLWVGTANGGLFVSDDPDAATPAFKAISLEGADASPTIRALYEDADGLVWIGTEGDGLFLAPAGAAQAQRVALPAGQGGERATIRGIAADGAGIIWAGTEGSGLILVEPDGSGPTTIRATEQRGDGIPGDQIRAVIRDNAGLMWVGMKDRGVAVGNPSAPLFGMRPAGGNSGLPRGTVRGFAQDAAGTLWLASDGGGLISYDVRADGYRDYFGPAGASGGRLCSVLVARDGSVYAGSDGDGLYRLVPGQSRMDRVPLGADLDPEDTEEGGSVVWALLEDTRGSLWVGLEGSGLVQLRPDGSRVRYPYAPDSPDGLAGRSVRCLLEDEDGGLLIGTWDGGLHRLDPAGGTLEHYPSGWNKDFGTSDVAIYSIIRDTKNRIWVGTGSGLDRFERKPDGVAISRIPLGPLPRRPSVFGIAEDGAGALWLSTESGLLRYHPDSVQLQIYTKADGLQNDHFAAGSFLRLADGRLAFGGVEGFNLFDPAALPASGVPPPVHIVSLLPLDRMGPMERSVVIPRDQSRIRVPYATSGFSLGLAVLDYTDPDKNLYALRIEGKQHQRYYLGTSNTAIVPRLAPGEYRFIAVGAGNRGVWNEAGSSVTVEVVPPFWLSPAALVALGAGILLLVYAVVRLRLSRLEHRTRELRELSAHIHDAREEERTEIAREVHDQLGQTLTAVKMGLYWARESAQGSSESLKEKMAELLEYTDLVLDSVKSLSTRLRPTVLDTLSLREALEWLARDFARWSGLVCRTQLDPTPLALDRRTATTVFRVLQENLTNTARHSGATEIEVRLAVSRDWIELRIHDNGHGIDLSTVDGKRHFGIVGMRERCAYLGGFFDIFPDQNGGTVSLARLPCLVRREDEDA